MPSLTSILASKRLTVAVAESCTGGLISKKLTDAPGSSAWFLLGVIAYANKAKQSVLGIPARLITRRGAVSAETAKAMARGVRRLGGTDCGIGITGIAGPTGGTGRKPVGTVFIAAAAPRRLICRKYRFNGTRAAIRSRAADAALRLLLSSLS